MTTKTRAAIWTTTTLTAAAGNTTSSAVDMTTSERGGLQIKLTNGATGPTVAAQVQIEVSDDNTNWFTYGPPLVGSTANNGVRSWGEIEIPVDIMYFRLVAGSNTGQDVTVNASVAKVT